MTRLLVIRHGNTFAAEEEPRRVGCCTDIPLVQSGVEQARALGCYLKRENLIPDYVYASALQRAQQTAQIMIHDTGVVRDIITDTTFNEIDHGPDENQTEDQVLARIGRDALAQWNEFGVAPDGWNVNPRAIQQSWLDFAQGCVESRANKLTCVVSSGGIIRFAPIILSEARLPEGMSPKVKTAAMALFIHDGHQWQLEFWNKRPD